MSDDNDVYFVDDTSEEEDEYLENLSFEDAEYFMYMRFEILKDARNYIKELYLEMRDFQTLITRFAVRTQSEAFRKIVEDKSLFETLASVDAFVAEIMDKLDKSMNYLNGKVFHIDLVLMERPAEFCDLGLYFNLKEDINAIHDLIIAIMHNFYTNDNVLIIRQMMSGEC